MADQPGKSAPEAHEAELAGPASSSASPFSLAVSWRGKPLDLPDSGSEGDLTLGRLKQIIEQKTGVRVVNQKLVLKGRALTDPDLVLLSLGGAVKLVLIGSTDADVAVVNTVPKIDVRVRDDLTGDGAGARRGLRRPGGSSRRQYGFGSIEVLPGLSEPERARAILEELATDPGVLHVLEKHRWNVGALCELYPEGYVGVSDVCVMGLNQNRGQRIFLRLRTDDLKGFRKILSIRKVLYHELSHMQNDEHDDKFYVLMREIERDVNAYNQAGRALGGAARFAPTGAAEGVVVDGHRLGGGSSELQRLFTPRELAGMAAQQRLTEEEQRIEEGCGCRGPAHARAGDEHSPIIRLGSQEREVSQVPQTEEGPVDMDITTDGTAPASPPQSGSCSHEHHDGPCPSEQAASPPPVVLEEVELQQPQQEAEDSMDVVARGEMPATEPASSGGMPPSQPQEALGEPPAVPEEGGGGRDEVLEQLMSMGFEEQPARRALSAFGRDLGQAADYLINHGGQADGLGPVEREGGAAGLSVDPLSREGRLLDSVRRMSREIPDREARRQAMETLLSMIRNMLDHPEEEKFRRVRLANAKFQSTVGRHLAGIDFLRAIGFEEDQSGQQLVLRRNDPGLLWLGRSALQEHCDAA